MTNSPLITLVGLGFIGLCTAVSFASKGFRPEDLTVKIKNPAVVDGRRVRDPKIFSSKLKFAAIGLRSSATPTESAELVPMNEFKGSG